MSNIKLGVIAGVLIAVVLAATLRFSLLVQPEPELTDSELVALLTKSARWVEPRLSFSGASNPCERSPPAYLGTVTVQRPRCEKLEARPENLDLWYRAQERLAQSLGDSAESHHLSGLWFLMYGSAASVERTSMGETPASAAVQQATEHLETAKKLGLSSPGLSNDLGAALLVQGQISNDPIRLLRGLEHFLEALDKDPKLASARFNLALTLGHLGFVRMAESAWQDYLEMNPDSHWSAEAHDHLRELAVNDLERSVNLRPTRRFAENWLLGAWVNVETQGDRAFVDQILTEAEVLGGLIVELGGDALFLDSILSLEHADPGERDSLAQGHRSYSAALDAFSKRDFPEATVQLRAAIYHLDGLSPFVHRARFLEQRIAYQEYEHDRALALGRALASELDPGRYPVLAGRVRWVLATTLVAVGLPAEAADLYQAAGRLLGRAGEPSQRTAVDLMRAGCHDDLGDRLKAWRLRVAAGRRAAYGTRERERTFLVGAAFSAAELGLPRVALAIADAYHDASNDAESKGTSSWHRSVFLLLQGRKVEARRAVEDSLNELAAFQEEAHKKALEANLALTEGRILVDLDPALAVQKLGLAESEMLGLEFPYHLPTLWHQRARAHEALSDLDSAIRDLETALSFLEEQRDRLEPSPERMIHFDQVGDIYGYRLSLELQRSGSPTESLLIAEQSRARVLFDWLQGQAETSEKVRSLARQRTAPPTDWLASMPADTLALEMEVLPGKLVSWVVSSEGIEPPIVQHVDLRDLVADVTAFRRGLQSDRLDRVLGARLWRLIFGPVQSRLKKGETLILAADDVLHSLPFAALLNPNSGQLLIQDHPLVQVPSLSVHAELRRQSLRRRKAFPAKNRRAVVVANPQFDSRRFNLPSLSDADLEGHSIAQRFPASVSLVGERATPSEVAESLVDAGLLHIAAHAQSNGTAPLMSYLLLAPEDDRDGRVFSHDLLEWPLDSVNLVVLSACGTAQSGGSLGREDAVGLVWPLLARGVPTVVGSLWSVRDGQTRNLFDRFYDGVLSGIDPAQALRSAQLAQLKGADTYNWAAFQVYGVAENVEREWLGFW